MCVHQTEKTVQDLDIINQLILGDTSNEKSGIYILPVFTHKVEIAAVLFGLKCTIEQLSLHYSNANEKESGQLFFWVKQPQDCEDSVFNQNILKTCHYFQITSKCLVSIQDDEANIKLYVNEEPSQTTVKVKDAAEWLMTLFWEKFKNESLETFVITRANEDVAVAEPQTNMGRMARKLKADQLVKELDLTQINLPNETT
ncbi:hypothetical protein [Acinetobacter bereziniae]|uniref:hypothetical protein n=1 Tax=Acinetobacter bereziniae TaxID=106648 RepID=UPI001D0DDD7E|nr:hypothetical protein [Acinetobacter bereziniae]